MASGYMRALGFKLYVKKWDAEKITGGGCLYSQTIFPKLDWLQIIDSSGMVTMAAAG